ncbi:hypothetical protein DM02DRAFT_604449 [Periconia macrospinosa]|uniref:Uncharacterized protein n=1 Tax=Periconia macrospinosa TaxID=97972 RepID=A0A2V1D7E2_9PLEO|nr:hypothetical protein DM02DRAFT_604449 [Periconia macrospinosa]
MKSLDQLESLESSSGISATWLPYTLRWQFMLASTLVALCLSSCSLLLVWYSTNHSGLGDDNGTSIVLFGWRFVPTLMAVLYTQLTTMLFDDVKRTEPFHRLTKAYPKGASGANTILQTRPAWWSALADGFSKKKNGGQRSTALIYSAMINITAFLLISPLSSSLLTSRTVSISENLEFRRMIPARGKMIVLSPGRETFLRTTSNFLANISSTDWITDSYVVLPFWPSEQKPNLGLDILNKPGSWEVDAMVFSADLSCENMSLVSMETTRRAYTEKNYNCSTSPHELVQFCNDSPPRDPVLVLDGYIPLILLSTTPWTFRSPWSDDIDGMYDEYSTMPSITNMTIAKNISLQCLLCSPTYTMAVVPITVSRKSGSIQIAMSEDNYAIRHIPVPDSLMDRSAVQLISLSQNWTKAVGGARDSYKPGELLRSGLASVLSTRFSNNLTNMIGNPELIVQASRLRKRFFHELIFSSVAMSGAFEIEAAHGVQVMAHKRVIVVAGVGITLAILLGLSSCLTIVLWYHTRLSRRPMSVQNDPALTVNLAMLMNSQLREPMYFQELHRTTNKISKQALQFREYHLSNSQLHEVHNVRGKKKDFVDIHVPAVKRVANWKPISIRFYTLVMLLTLLLGLLIAISVLHEIAVDGALYQGVFVYQVDTSLFSDYWAAFSPFSFLPSIIAILIGLWWGSLDGTIRSLEPYVSMSRSPKPMASGVGLAWTSSYWIWASVRAIRKKNWGIAGLTLGTTLSQILIVSMSALFEINSGSSLVPLKVQRSLELRQNPIIQYDDRNFDWLIWDRNQNASETSYRNSSTSWIYSATNQLTLQGAGPRWSLDEWSFVPLNLSQISQLQIRQQSMQTLSSYGKIQMPSTNVILKTSAIRSSLKCEPIPLLEQKSSWVIKHKIRYPSGLWTASKLPLAAYTLGTRLLNNTKFNTSLLADPADALGCCINRSSNTHQSATGYWSKVAIDAPAQWPEVLPFVSKWMLGNAYRISDVVDLSQYRQNDTRELISDFDHNDIKLDRVPMLFSEQPALQAVYCDPIIETAEASVTVDVSSGQVQEYRILDNPQVIESPWLEMRVRRANKDKSCSSCLNCSNCVDSLNLDVITTDRQVAKYVPRTWIVSGVSIQDNSDQGYAFRDETLGLNLDLMTYAMFVVAGRSPHALLNATTLMNATQRVFQTYFQHFVAAGWAYQTINESLPSDFPPPLPWRGTDTEGTIIQLNATFNMTLPPMYPRARKNDTKERVYAKLDTNRTTVANVSEPVDALYISDTATWLSVAILAWLIVITVVIIGIQIKHRHLMFRNVECIADVLVLIAGSDNFLKLLVGERGAELAKDESIHTRLGWFRKPDGEVRYGIEVVGGENAVEWVDAPEHLMDASSVEGFAG